MTWDKFYYLPSLSGEGIPLTYKVESREFSGGPVVKTVLSLLMAPVQSLVTELRTHKPYVVGEERKNDRVNFFFF